MKVWIGAILVALLLQQPGGDGGIDPAGQADDDTVQFHPADSRKPIPGGDGAGTSVPARPPEGR